LGGDGGVVGRPEDLDRLSPRHQLIDSGTALSSENHHQQEEEEAYPLAPSFFTG
jgi:hypothetical protein